MSNIPEEKCWQTGIFTDECQCEMCMHLHECSASGYDDEDESNDDE